jgi:hypothetical protein
MGGAAASAGNGLGILTLPPDPPAHLRVQPADPPSWCRATWRIHTTPWGGIGPLFLGSFAVGTTVVVLGLTLRAPGALGVGPNPAVGAQNDPFAVDTPMVLC